MKMTALLFSLLGVSAAIQPPRISLDLNGIHDATQILKIQNRTWVHDRSTSCDSTALGGCAKTPDANYDSVGSRQDITLKCHAKNSVPTSSTWSCTLPSAKAYDHFDKELSVETRLFVAAYQDSDTQGQTDLLATPVCTSVPCERTDISTGVTSVQDQIAAKNLFDHRAVLVLKYDCQDHAGNHAEQVVVVLELDDVVPPTVTPKQHGTPNDVAWTHAMGSLHIEAGAFDFVLAESTAHDLYDGDVDVSYTLEVDNNVEETEASFSTIRDRITPSYNTTTRVAKHTGVFKITSSAHDNAGIYGFNDADNSAEKHRMVKVSDTKAPVIIIGGLNPIYHECATTYTEGDVSVADHYDVTVRGLTITPEVKSNDVDATAVGDYAVEYGAEDEARNAAVDKIREVFVRDSTVPALTLTGGDVIVNHGDPTPTEPGFTCTDTCDANPTTTVKFSHLPVSEMIGTNALGQFVREYKCCDASSNCITKYRKFIVKDNTAPTLTLKTDCTPENDDTCAIKSPHTSGEQAKKDSCHWSQPTCPTDASVGSVPSDLENCMSIEASRSDGFDDPGANCFDSETNSQLKHAVEISGDTVLRRVPGVYTIHYTCRDLAGNQATASRIVVVKDTRRPKIVMKGAANNYVEAGFPYYDAHVVASDDMDGDVSRTVTTSLVYTEPTDGHLSSPYDSVNSCAELDTTVNGFYKIAVPLGSELFQADIMYGTSEETSLVWCAKDCQKTYKLFQYEDAFTIEANKFCNTQKSFVVVTDQSDICNSLPDEYKTAATAQLSLYGSQTALSAGNNVLCVMEDAAWATNNPKGKLIHIEGGTKVNNVATDLNGAFSRPGKYTITYHVSDNAGNVECEADAALTREVVVDDTMPPVLALHYNGKMIQKSTAGDGDSTYHAKFGGNTASNPANDAQYNPQLHDGFMAESSTTAPWFIGAAVSALTGLVFVAIAGRQRQTSMPVPV